MVQPLVRDTNDKTFKLSAMGKLHFSKLLIFSLISVASAKTIHVSPSGNDLNPGTEQSAVQSLHRAQALVRTFRQSAPDESVTVLVHAGDYRLSQALVFEEADSGSAQAPVTWKGVGEVRVSGGRSIVDWKLDQDGIWKTMLPEVAAGQWNFRDLYVDGKRVTRARTPNRSEKHYARRVLGAGHSADGKEQTIQVAPEDLKQWDRLQDVEIGVIKNWSSFHKKIDKVDPATGTMWLKPPHVNYRGSNRPKRGTYYWFENALEFLDAPGEWYLNRKSGVLHYKPIDGGNPNESDIVAPVISHCLQLRGEPGKPVQFIHFENLTIEHSNYLLPEQGHHGRQAGFQYWDTDTTKKYYDGQWNGLPSMIEIENAADCTFSHCVIRHAGAGGIEVKNGSNRINVSRCEIYDTGANGFGVGGHNDEKLCPKNTSLTDSHIYHAGQTYLGACGVWGGIARNTSIIHNEIERLPYSGISIGWVWTHDPSAAHSYHIEYNHVHDVMREVSDGGAFYSLGIIPETTLRFNHIHGVERGPYAHASPNNGLFLDEASDGFLIEGNVIYDTAGRSVRHNRNRPSWHVWKDNYFGGNAQVYQLAQGKLGQAWAGGAAKKVAHAANLDPAVFTLTAWVKFDEKRKSEEVQWVVGKNKNDWADGNFGLGLVGDKAVAYMNIGGGKAHKYTVSATEKQTMNPGGWYHLAMSYDGSELVLYVNGVVSGKQTIGKDRKPSSGSLVIGQRPDKGYRFNGLIDEVRLYGKALSPENISVLAETAEEDPAPEDLIDLWDFNTADAVNATAKSIEQIKRMAGIRK